VTATEAILRWQALSPERQLELRWRAIPKQVAASMAFEGEPVDIAWLEKLHQQTPRPVGLKQRAASSVTQN